MENKSEVEEISDNILSKIDRIELRMQDMLKQHLKDVKAILGKVCNI